MGSNDFFLEMISGKRPPRIEKIEDFTHRYPWCAIGHKSLFTALCAQNEEAWLSYASKASAYLFHREELYMLAHTHRPVFEPFSVEEPAEKSVSNKTEEEFEIISDPVERIVVVGGDYFAPSDLHSASFEEQNPIDKFIKNEPKLPPVKQTQDEKEEKTVVLHVDDDNFMTETLAKIYADQSLYHLAIDAYKKLILLYPKKSDYFASLILDLKYQLNR